MEADGDLGIVDSSSTPEYSKYPVDDDTSEVEGVEFDKPLTSAPVTKTSRAVIYAPSGKPRPVSSTRYITVGEGDYLGSFWIVKNPGEDTDNPYRSTANQITVEINGFTGGTSYKTPDKYPAVAE